MSGFITGGPRHLQSTTKPRATPSASASSHFSHFKILSSENKALTDQLDRADRSQSRDTFCCKQRPFPSVDRAKNKFSCVSVFLLFKCFVFNPCLTEMFKTQQPFP